ncbi:MAG: DUF3365 domain-containing protein [Nitrospira sp.]|nr:DUF3365 domain-containing protein [Nitrospira sp.]
MHRNSFGWGLAIGAFVTCLLGQLEVSSGSKVIDPPHGIPPEMVAEYLHAVIQADRAVYTTEVVERMQMRGIVSAAENWRESGRLPLPAQFLIEAGRLVAEQRTGLRFRLISNWPINKRNSPRTDFEKAGLAAIQANSDRPYTGFTTEGKTRYFQALYADKAVSQSCIGCHNAHPDSSKKDFKLQSVMGGLLLTIPLAP